MTRGSARATRPDEVVDVSVVVPTYGGARNLPSLVESICAVLEARTDSFEVIVVNDASPDDTWEVLRELTRRDARVIAIDFLSNKGQPVATMCGLAHSRGRIVVTMDDDHQHPPDQVPVLLDALSAAPDLDAVVGTWPRDEGGLRNLGSRVYGFLDRLAWGTPRGFHHTGFRAMRRTTVDALVAHETRSPVIGPTLHRVTRRVRNVPVRHDERRSGQSGFRFLWGARHALVNFGQGSVAPLHALTLLGVGVAMLSAVVAVTMVGRWAMGADPPAGWLSVFLATLFFGGLNLLGIGLLGQYVQLIVREVRGEPRWSIRETQNVKSPRVLSEPDAGRRPV